MVYADPWLFTSVQTSSYPSGDNISCNGLSDGSISIEVEGGTTPYDYQWSNGVSTEDINNVEAGNYTLTVTDANGCVIDTTIILTEPLLLTQDITSPTFASGDNISCFGENDGSIDYTVNGGSPVYTINWNNGETTEDLSNLAAGSYSVTTTDINGCSIDTLITLTEPAPLTQDITSPTYFSGDNISCNGSTDGSIDYTINGGTPNYSFVWDNGETTEDLSDLSVGTYQLTVTDLNGCTIDTSITLTEPDPLTQNITAPVLAGGFNISCFGATDGSIDYTIVGGTPGYNFEWDNGATSEDLNSLMVGTYSVSVTDMNGCTIDTSIILTQPPLLEVNAQVTSDYNGQDISCYGASDAVINAEINGGVLKLQYVLGN